MACPPEACAPFEPPLFFPEGCVVVVSEPPPPYPPPDPLPDPPPDPPPPDSPLLPPQAASTEEPAAPTPRAVPRRIKLLREIFSCTDAPFVGPDGSYSYIRKRQGSGSRIPSPWSCVYVE